MQYHASSLGAYKIRAFDIIMRAPVAALVDQDHLLLQYYAYFTARRVPPPLKLPLKLPLLEPGVGIKLMKADKLGSHCIHFGTSASRGKNNKMSIIFTILHRPHESISRCCWGVYVCTIRYIGDVVGTQGATRHALIIAWLFSFCCTLFLRVGLVRPLSVLFGYYSHGSPYV